MLNKKIHFLLLGIPVFIITILGYTSGQISHKYLGNDNNTNNNTQTTPQNITEKGNNGGATSGSVKDVPWAADERFKDMQTKAGAPVQMAAFHTVLRDPLPGEEQNVHIAARILSGTVVKPGQTFSMNRTIGPYSSARGFQKGPVYIGSQLKTTIGGGVCKMASTLYNVTVLCNLPVIERHAHGMPVPYVPYGQDATVSTGAADFRFKNDLPYPVLIWAQGVDNTLYVAFYGQGLPPQVEWHHEFLQHYKTRTIYRRNSSLPKGTEKVVVEGMDGALVKSWVTVTTGEGTTITKELGLSSYKPLPYVIERR